MFGIQNVVEQNKFKYPMIIWVHGSEALGWYRRLFNVDIKFIKYVLQNMIQMMMSCQYWQKKNLILKIL